MTVVAGPEVKNFDNLKVGGQVLMSYYQGILAQIVEGGKNSQTPPPRASRMATRRA